MSTKLPDAKEIFLAVAKAPADQWESRVEEACEGNDEVCRRVRELLIAHAQPGSFLEQPAMDLGATAQLDRPVTERLGERIGHYRLMEQIGEGGMGVVFVAEQQKPVRRKVALKIIKPGMDTKEVVARFAAERQALALMDHPNIAKVLDAGETESGCPYFVMELVRGIPVTEYCDQNKLTVGERLHLFIKVCLAVQHAHQKGIIHRDVKPTNVLVTLHDGRPVPKVIDFGVAKAINQQLTERTIYTKFAQMIGTPMYMSPEQAELSGLDVDTRSDVYSLGVLLYELLTGSTPFDKQQLLEAAYDEIRRIIREEEPPKPSTKISTLGDEATAASSQRRTDARKLRRLLSGDLDWIVMKALEKDRTRRYETANGLAQDVQRYLDHEPVVAQAPSSLYRFRKLVRRNKMPCAATLAVLAALLIGMIGTAIAARHARRAEAEAIMAAQDAQDAEAKALADVKRLCDEFLDRAVNQAVIGELEHAREAIAKAKLAGAREESLQALDGIALFLSGKTQEAIESLESSLETHPSNVSAQSNLMWAYWSNLQPGKSLNIAQDVRPIILSSLADPQVRQSDFEKVFAALPLICFDNGQEIDEMIQRLNDIIETHYRWGIAYTVRAAAWTKKGAVTRNLEYMHQALEDHNRAEALVPASGYVQCMGLYDCVAAIRLAKAQGHNWTVWQAKADELLPKLDDWPQFITAMLKLAYFRITDQCGRAERFEAQLVHGLADNVTVQGSMLFDKRQLDQLKQFVSKRFEQPFAELALAFALAEESDAGRQQALELFSELRRRPHNDSLFQLYALSIPLILGMETDAIDEARRLLETESDCWYWVKYTAEYLVGEEDEADFLESAAPLYYADSMAQFWVGMKSLAHGDKLKAKEHFGKIRDTGNFAGPSYHWGNAFYARLKEDPDWPHWIPTKNGGESPGVPPNDPPTTLVPK